MVMVVVVMPVPVVVAVPVIVTVTVIVVRPSRLVPVRRLGPVVLGVGGDGHADLDVHVHPDVHSAARTQRHRHVRLTAHPGVDHQTVRVPALALGAGGGGAAAQRAHGHHTDRSADQSHPPPGGRSPTIVLRYPSELPTLRHGLHTPLGSTGGRQGLGLISHGEGDRVGRIRNGKPIGYDQMPSNAIRRTARRRGRAVRHQVKRSSRRPVTACAHRSPHSAEHSAPSTQRSTPDAQWRRCAISTFSRTPTASGTRIAQE
jgi:hypothetical protein